MLSEREIRWIRRITRSSSRVAWLIPAAWLLFSGLGYWRVAHGLSVTSKYGISSLSQALAIWRTGWRGYEALEWYEVFIIEQIDSALLGVVLAFVLTVIVGIAQARNRLILRLWEQLQKAQADSAGHLAARSKTM